MQSIEEGLPVSSILANFIMKILIHEEANREFLLCVRINFGPRTGRSPRAAIYLLEVSSILTAAGARGAFLPEEKVFLPDGLMIY